MVTQVQQEFIDQIEFDYKRGLLSKIIYDSIIEDTKEW